MKKTYRIISFDCYGTLIDWETGLTGVLGELARKHNTTVSDIQLLNDYSQFEPEAESGAFKNYRRVLQIVMRAFGQKYNWTLSQHESGILGDTLPFWPLFADTQQCIELLKDDFKIGIISNVDDDLIQQTLENGGLKVDFVTTAEESRAYKPSAEPFRRALQKYKCEPGEVLHCGCSPYHDIGTAHSLGMATAWINRRMGKEGSGATPAGKAEPDYTFSSLLELTGYLQKTL